MTDVLQKLFGSPARVKLLRLFLFNPKESFTLTEVARRSRVPEKDARSEIKLFRGIGLIKSASRGHNMNFILDSKFPHIEGLQYLLLNTKTHEDNVHKFLGGIGSLKLIVLTGFFVGDGDNSIDILFVGDNVDSRKLREKISRLEAEMGRTLEYAVLTRGDFSYRQNFSDKLFREIFDNPHQIVLDKLNIGLK